MRIRTFIGVAMAFGLLALPSVASAAACCDHENKACCEEMANCCKNDPFAEAVLIPQPEQQARPARERVLVKFWNPVLVGDRILMGKYVIEHDTERMAQGGPCTYIYEADDLQMPVLAFHCVHLDRPHSDHASVTLVPTGDANGTRRFTEFQFAGEAAGHGVPTGR